MDELRPRLVRRLVQGHMAVRAILVPGSPDSQADASGSPYPAPAIGAWAPDLTQELSGANQPARRDSGDKKGEAAARLQIQSPEEKTLLWELIKL